MWKVRSCQITARKKGQKGEKGGGGATYQKKKRLKMKMKMKFTLSKKSGQMAKECFWASLSLTINFEIKN